METPATDAADIPDRPTIYRSVSAVFGGSLIVVLCVAGIVDLLANGYLYWRLGACALLLAVLAFIFGPYPAAFSDAHRLVVRNPFRRIVLPWPRVTAAHAGLSMTVNDEDNRHYTVWSVPVSMRARRKVDRAQMRLATIARKEAARAQRASAGDFEPSRPRRGGGSRLGGFGGTGAYGGTGGNEHGDYAYADQAEQELEARRAACTDARDDTAPVEARWTWWTMALSAAGVVAVAIAFAAG